MYYVGPNVLALEKLYAFPPREFRLWLALHEVTHRAQFTGVPWMRPHFLGLVEQMLDAVDPDPQALPRGHRSRDRRRPPGRNPLADGGVMALVASDDQRAVLDQVSGLMSLLEGHGDVTMDRAGEGLIPSAERFSRVLRQRRQSAQGLARLLQQLIGLEAKLAQYEQGERFIETVEAERPARARPGLGATRATCRRSTRSATRRPGWRGVAAARVGLTAPMALDASFRRDAQPFGESARPLHVPDARARR